MANNSERFKEPKFTAKEIELLRSIWNTDPTGAGKGDTQAGKKKPGKPKTKAGK